MPEADYFEQSELWQGSAASGPNARRIRETIDLIPREVTSVADLGAGDGSLLAALDRARPGLRTSAIERSRAAVVRVEAPRIVGSVDRVPLRDRSVDCVTICEVIEHLPEQVYGATLGELGRVARTFVVITVPHAEDLRRARVTCPACGCRFNRYTHLRSFRTETMRSLVPGFELVEAREIGPRGPWYPWWARTIAERIGVVGREGWPICPQCGAGERSGADGELRQSVGRLKRVLPRARHSMWLGALYRRSPSRHG